MIDRSPCDARKHGDHNAYMNDRCRCPDAKNAQRLYVKRRKLARARGQFGRHDLVATYRVTRRFQALARIGYSAREVQERAWGYKRSNGTQSWMNRAAMSQVRFTKLDAVYRHLSAIPGTNWRTRAYAIRKGWPSPLDWTDIDDPREIPFNQINPARMETA